MKKIVLILLAVLLLATSCSRKIVGATRHRRDRNCGCEMPTASPQDSLLTLTMYEE